MGFCGKLFFCSRSQGEKRNIMEKKPEALASAFFDAKSKKKRIKELGITPDMSQEKIDALK